MGETNVRVRIVHCTETCILYIIRTGYVRLVLAAARPERRCLTAADHRRLSANDAPIEHI